jgi:hypothetical protein
VFREVQGFEEIPNEGGDRGIVPGGPDPRLAVCFVGDGYGDVFHGSQFDGEGWNLRSSSHCYCATAEGNLLQDGPESICGLLFLRRFFLEKRVRDEAAIGL